VIMVMGARLAPFFCSRRATWLIAACKQQTQANGQCNRNRQKVSRHWLSSFDSFDPIYRNYPSPHRTAINGSGEYSRSFPRPVPA
jgi:hypothetical protein